MQRLKLESGATWKTGDVSKRFEQREIVSTAG